MSNPEKQISAPAAAESVTSDVLKRSADSWWRTQSATMALLKHAYHQIGASEKRIAEQDRRIRQLEDLAATDSLTDLMNRRGFEKFFEHELARIRRLHSPGALLVLIDLDRFKPINDTYGHPAGDACLKLVAEKLIQSIRMLDGAARLGGDEFALLLTQLAPENALLRSQKIRHALDDVNLDWQGKQLRFGASFGMEIITANSTFDAAYRAADEKLYDDKKSRKKSAARKA